MKNLRILGTFCLSSLVGLAAMADARTGCYLEIKDQAEIVGLGNTNIDKLETLASTSKMITTEWALEKLGPTFQFETKIFVEKISGTDGEARVHIQGSYDPYFGASQLKFLRDQLAGIGIKKVQKLTFDENFKFMMSPRSSPNTNGVIDAKTGWMFGYPTISRVLSELQLAGVNNALFLAAKDFREKADTAIFTIPSPVLIDLLRDMNRLSNNYVANVLFDFLGGPEAFLKRTEQMGIADQFEIINGSGMWMILDGEKEYNKASCRALINSLNHTFEMLTHENLSFEDVVAIDGVYSGDQCSTMDGDPNKNSCKGGAYEVEPLIGAVSAKTGYVNSTVALAGKFSAQKGQVLFVFLTGPGGGRIVIRNAVAGLISQFGGAKKLDYKPREFRYFPQGQKLIPLMPVAKRTLP